MSTSVLTPLQLTAGAGLLNNAGIGVSSELQAAIAAYFATPLVAAANVAGYLGYTANSVPAFTDAVPIAFGGNLGGWGTSVMSNAIIAQARFDSGANVSTGVPNTSKFCQIIAIADSYVYQTNVFINSAYNAQNYLNNTFTNMDNTVTGDVTQVNLATPAFAQDLAALGSSIDLLNLNNLGSPLALLQQIYKVANGGIPVISVALNSVGVPVDIILNLTDPKLSVTDSIQKLIYTAMTQITGSDLTQVLTVLNVTTPNINTLADLLNPVKQFPNSFQSLTVPTINGSTPIYIDSAGGVNTQLTRLLPPYVVSSLI